MSTSIVCALQIGSEPDGTAATLHKILNKIPEIKASGAHLVVIPEAVLGGYPKGETFGTKLGYRLPEGRETFARYFAQAVEIPGKETDVLADMAKQCSCNLVIGVIERSGSTLYCTSLTFTPTHGLVAKHRKLMPTGSERLIWGQGDGSTLPVVETSVGKLGSVICWENHMPLLRAAMYAKGIEVWCAPTVDERDIWQSSMRHIAHEGRCFVISACQYQPAPQYQGIVMPDWEASRPLIRGGSVIISPMGEVLAGPLYNEEGLITATIDLNDIVKARYDFDVVGHYARPDVFNLRVDTGEKISVAFDFNQKP